MNILEETFLAHEDLAPDSAEVLREIRRSVAARRRRPDVRLLAVAGTGVAVAAVAAGSVVLSGTTATPPAPRPTSAAVSHHVVPKVVPTETRVPGPDHNTFGAVWLPGDNPDVVLASNNLRWGQEIEYVMKADGQEVAVLIQYGPTWDARSKTGPGAGKTGTFQGHPSQTWDAGGYWKLEYRIDATHVAIVEVVVGTDAQGSGAAAIGEHVARELRFDLDTPIDPGGYLTYLPAGVHLTGVNAQTDWGIAWTVGRDGTKEDDPLVQVVGSGGNDAPRTIKLSGAPASANAPRGEAGRPVQGHPTTVERHGDEITLTVSGLLPGHDVQFFSSAAVPSLEDLYAVADGLRRS